MNISYTGSSNQYDCLELPLTILPDEKVTEINLKFVYVLEKTFPIVKKISLVYKKDDGSNSVLRFGKKKGKCYSIILPRKFCLTHSDVSSKKFFLLVTYDHDKLIDPKLIVKWMYKKIKIDKTQQEQDMSLTKYFMILDEKYIKLRATVYSSVSSFVICSDVKNQYLVIDISGNSISQKYYDFGVDKNSAVLSINEQVENSLLTNIGNYELFYDSKKLKFYTSFLEPLEFNLMNGENSISVTNEENTKSFPYRGKK